MTAEDGTAPRRIPSLPVQIVIGMAVGVAAGVAFSESGTRPPAVLGEVGKLVIQLIKAAAVPLLFLVIVNALLSAQVRMSAGARMAAIATLNATLALTIGLALSNWFQPGTHLSQAALTGSAPPPKVAAQGAIDPVATLRSFVPESWVQPFAENLVIPVVVMAVLLACALKRVRREQLAVGERAHEGVIAALSTLQQTMLVVLGWVIALVPIAVCAVVAKAVGEYGFAPLRGLAWYVGVALLGMALHVAIVHQAWIVLAARFTLAAFWRQARTPAVYALGVNSSLATLPLTLAALDRLGVSRPSSSLGACVGTNLNNDGIILYEAMAVLLVAQAAGIELSLGQQVVAAVACLVAAIGVAGVPESGFVSLAVVLATVGLPAEILPLLLTVDWIIARARSFTNVLSDMVVSTALDRWRDDADAGPRTAAA